MARGNKGFGVIRFSCVVWPCFYQLDPMSINRKHALYQLPDANMHPLSVEVTPQKSLDTLQKKLPVNNRLIINH